MTDKANTPEHDKLKAILEVLAGGEIEFVTVQAGEEDEDARPEPASSLTRADLSPSYPTPSPDVERRLKVASSGGPSDRYVPGASLVTYADLRQAADLIVSQQGEIERLRGEIDRLDVARLSHIRSTERLAEDVAILHQRATKAEALLVKAREALTNIASATDAENDESYRADDREGCLDYVSAEAKSALLAITEVLG